MAAATVFGVFLVPVFYTMLQGFVERRAGHLHRGDAAARIAVDVEFDRDAGNLRKTPGGARQHRKPVLHRALQVGP